MSSGASILYIEDNAQNAALISGVMQLRPHVELTIAERGGEGLAIAAERSHDLILLDLHLPDMHGRDVLAALRQQPRNENVPVVILSADAMPSTIAGLEAAGADGYLTKPLNVAELLAKVDSICSAPVAG